MAITKTQKHEQVADLVSNIEKASSIIVWEYHGLDAEKIAQVRTSVRKTDGINVVYKNRLAKIAFKQAGKPEIVDYLVGPNSFLFTLNNESNALKELNNFVKQNNKISFKAGYIDGVFYDSAAITEIAGLPSKDELLSMLLSVLEAPVRNLAYSLSQVAEKAE